jgi:hypothetical protein
MRSYLYDSSGRWIGFRTDPEGRYLFDPSGDWIGWFPWADNDDALSPDGRYLGTVVEKLLAPDQARSASVGVFADF